MTRKRLIRIQLYVAGFAGVVIQVTIPFIEEIGYMWPMLWYLFPFLLVTAIFFDEQELLREYSATVSLNWGYTGMLIVLTWSLSFQHSSHRIIGASLAFLAASAFLFDWPWLKSQNHARRGKTQKESQSE